FFNNSKYTIIFTIILNTKDMKRSVQILVMLMACVAVVSCSSKDKTIANLKAAIDGEVTAVVTYNAYADQAAKDSLNKVEAMFRATSKAESVHLNSHLKALKELEDADYKPNIKMVECSSTMENLQEAINGETTEFATMYPKFLADAKAEGAEGAVATFNYALDAEMQHAKIYAETLSKLTTGVAIDGMYYVCPICGYVYVGVPESTCKLCKCAAGKFIVYNSEIPTSDSYTGASPKTE
ncbi:MAG: ferritin family protein, partial [Muribaculaceae bacterium]